MSYWNEINTIGELLTKALQALECKSPESLKRAEKDIYQSKLLINAIKKYMMKGGKQASE